jgi:hypothetical protein
MFALQFGNVTEVDHQLQVAIIELGCGCRSHIALQLLNCISVHCLQSMKSDTCLHCCPAGFKTESTVLVAGGTGRVFARGLDTGDLQVHAGG